MYIWFVVSAFILVYARDMKIERRSNGDIIDDISQNECTKWHGKWNNNKCYCAEGATFYNNIGEYGCFNGTGNAIGCTLSINPSKHVGNFYKKGGVPAFTFPNELSEENCNLSAIQEWNNGGWKPKKLLKLKLKTRKLKISWNNLNYDNDVAGHLFKISGYCGNDQSETRSCLLIKSSGSQTYTFPVTIPPSPNPTTISANGRPGSGEGGSSTQMTVALGVTCAILIIILVTLFIIWYTRRGASKEKVNNFMNKIFRRKRTQNSDKQFENIYEDIGNGIMYNRDPSAANGDDKGFYLAPVEVHNHYNSAFNEESGYREAGHVGDFYEAPVEESLNGVVEVDMYDMPLEEPPNTPTNSDDFYETPKESELPDIYETPCDGNNIKEKCTSGYEGLLQGNRQVNSTRGEPYCRLSVQPTLPNSERYKFPTNNRSIDRNDNDVMKTNEDLYEEALRHSTPTNDPYYFQTRGSPR